jgi:hypothetical protein
MEVHMQDASFELSHLLSPAHLKILREGSAIADEVIRTRGYWTATDPAELRDLGFGPQQQRVPSLVLPVLRPDGRTALHQIRPDAPWSFDEKDKPRLPDGTYPQKVVKYVTPKGAHMALDVPPACRPAIGDPAVPLWITEGVKKADSLASAGLCAVGLLGVTCWKGRNERGGSVPLIEWESIALNGRAVRIVFDSDVIRKPEVAREADKLKRFLWNKGASVAIVYLPPAPGGGKMGVDDFFAAGHTRAELEALVEAPRPAPVAAPPLLEILDREPPTIRRPLSLIDGRGYAAVWLPVRSTVSSSMIKGELVSHNPPLQKTTTQLLIVCDDGLIFGKDAGAPLSKLGLEIVLPDIPVAARRWSSRGVKAFEAGYRPSPEKVFHRVTQIVDRFMDFSQSLGEQRTMSEMVACFILSSWFLDAFSVIGFLWPNGDRGCGKTHLLHVVCELSYLGQVILAGSSYASLRDMADYGATLAFDDAENVSNARKFDPDKRALLLAGNRRGATITVKEAAPDRTWKLRHIDAYCPRLFSAIELPDPVLASRSIVVPLIRTPDRFRANADPLDFTLWPVSRQELLDDLWGLGLSHLARLPAYEAQVNAQARLVGRNLEPWRAILAVALWLQDNGVEGVFERMEALSMAYQEERPDLEAADITVVVLKALLRLWQDHCANDANCANCANDADRLVVTSRTISETALEIVKEEESDLNESDVTAQKIGYVLHKRRIKRLKRERNRGAHHWEVTQGALDAWARAYGFRGVLNDVSVDDAELHPAEDVGAVGASGAVGANEEEREVFWL